MELYTEWTGWVWEACVKGAINEKPTHTNVLFKQRYILIIVLVPMFRLVPWVDALPRRSKKKLGSQNCHIFRMQSMVNPRRVFPPTLTPEFPNTWTARDPVKMQVLDSALVWTGLSGYGKCVLTWRCVTRGVGPRNTKTLFSVWSVSQSTSPVTQQHSSCVPQPLPPPLHRLLLWVNQGKAKVMSLKKCHNGNTT